MAWTATRNHTPPCSSEKLLFAERNGGQRRKNSVVSLVFTFFCVYHWPGKFLSEASKVFCWMWVCPARIHTPKPLCLYPLPPFFGLIDHLGFGLRPLPLLLLRALHHVRQRREIWGASVQGTDGPFTIIIAIFLGIGQGTAAPGDYPSPGHLSRLCPPIPLHRTLKEGHGGGWGGM